jgi:hypothetical protein
MPEWSGLRTGLTISRERADGSFLVREASEKEVFRSGDGFRLRLQTNFPAVNYLVSRDSDGKADVLLKRRTARLEEVSVPQEGWLRLDDQPGIESLVLIAGREELAALEPQPGTSRARSMTGREFSRLLAAITADISESFDENSMPNGGDAASSYLFARFTSDDDHLVRPLDLIHRPDRPKKA